MARSVATLIDSINFFVESQDITSSVLTVTASATGTYTGSDITNTFHKGGIFFINFTTIGATCTCRFSLQGKDPVSGLYSVIATASFDGLTTGNINSPFYLDVYPGVTDSAVTNGVRYTNIFPRVMRIRASITCTASVGGAAVTLTTGLSKVL